MSFHNTEVLSSLHTIYFRVYANAAARLGDGTLLSVDIGKVALQSDTSQYYILQNNSPVTWAAITGNGAGSGGINYVSQNDSDATDSVGAWIAYADADAVPLSKPGGATPGTGGSPTVTITRSTVSPLRSTASFLITKLAGTAQGQGVSVPFTIDAADQGKAITVSWDYQPGSGFVAGSDTVDSDIEAYVYDVTNNVVIQLSPYKLGTAATFTGSYGATFQTASNSTSYRLLLHIATANASAWTFKFDNVRVGPGTFTTASIATDWVSYVPILNNAPGITSNIAYWRRVGDTMHIKGTLEASGSGAGVLQVSLPAGNAIDVANKGADYFAGTTLDGVGQWFKAGVSHNLLHAIYATPTVFEFATDAAAGLFVSSSISVGDRVSYMVSFPILGWSSNVTLANLATSDTSPIACAYKSNANQSIANGTTPIPVIFGTKIFDTRGSFDGVSTFTAPASGKYLIQATVTWGAAENWTDSYNRLFVYKNGSVYLPVDVIAPHAVLTAARLGSEQCSIGMDLNAGDLITLRVQHDQVAPRTVSNNGISLDETWISIVRTGDSSLTIPIDNGPLPAGVILPFAGATTPGGYLSCDGSAVDRVIYARLFTAIGITHGQGNGTTTFNVPDYRGRFLRGVDGTTGRDPDKLTRTSMNTGGNAGNAVGSLQPDSFASHTHIQNPHQHQIPFTAFNYAAGAGLADSVTGASGTPTDPTTATNQNTGGNETRPVNAYVNYIVKI